MSIGLASRLALRMSLVAKGQAIASVAVAYPVRESATIEGRVLNWANSFLWGSGSSLRSAESVEGWYRSPQRWDAPPGRSRPLVDVHDAAVVESAIIILPLFDHTLLRSWYIFQGHRDEHMRDKRQALAMAARAAGCEAPRSYEFGGRINDALGRLERALTLPAVVRKVRARQIVKEVLDGMA